jgi:hypothetical protein
MQINDWSNHMKPRSSFRLLLVLVGSFCLTSFVWGQLPEPAADGEWMEGEPLLRGPIHEAYAEPLAPVDEEPFLAPKAPPEEIEELPPDARPEGDRVVWISGYWSWDDDRQDFIWVSGVWRNAPAGRTWVSGNWTPGPNGYRWVAGRWIQDGAVVAETLPAPPPSLDHGPTSEPRGEDYFWVPGCWRYQTNRYIWRPGFWSACHDNWVWVPDYYVNTPAGCVFVPGYWDYALEARGVLFAPYYFGPNVIVRRQTHFTPSVSIDVSNAFFHLWVRPNYCHYYFGDYYDSRYANFGIVPWYQFHTHYHRAYDPLYVHYRWRFGRDNVNLYSHLYHRHRDFQRHVDHRPAHRWHAGARGFQGGHHDFDREGSLGHYVGRDRDGGRAHRHLSTRDQRERLRNEVLRTHRDQLRNGVADAGRDEAVVPPTLGNRHSRPLASDYRLRAGGARGGDRDRGERQFARGETGAVDSAPFDPRGVPNQGARTTNPRTNSPAAQRVLEQNRARERGRDSNPMVGNRSNRELIDEWSNNRRDDARVPPVLREEHRPVDRGLSGRERAAAAAAAAAVSGAERVIRGNDSGAASGFDRDQMLNRRSRRDLAAQIQNGQGVRPLQRDPAPRINATPPAHLIPRGTAAQGGQSRAELPQALVRPNASRGATAPSPVARPRASQMRIPQAERPQPRAVDRSPSPAPGRGAQANPTLSRRTMKVTPRAERQGGRGQ